MSFMQYIELISGRKYGRLGGCELCFERLLLHKAELLKRRPASDLQQRILWFETCPAVHARDCCGSDDMKKMRKR